ncbi:hypothetical protein BOTCAL_0577g00020 [Botryotinia calthae]|uniref:RING-type domain-containing protein n=1 Tax=Botryotinia calthae TaxID=38488 RepID=A0A4Y8CJD3_9HELO|nr:hypothetical protein BOTCAL_0577g00020 [Botryotinia calthae]
MNHPSTNNNGAVPRTSLLRVDHESVIQANLKNHKHEFFFIEQTSDNEETSSNEGSPFVTAEDDVPTDEESSNKDTECQECHWNIHRAQKFVVLHPCNCIFHLGCIKEKFYEDPRCPQCKTDTMKLRRMTPFEGRFVDKPLELIYVKLCIKNRGIYQRMHQSSVQDGQSGNNPSSRVDLIAVRRLVYETELYCDSGRSGRALDSIEICKQIFRYDPNARARMRAWIQREIRALKQITIVPDHRDLFENVVITTLQMENNTEEQKKRKDYAVHIVKGILGTYTNLFLHTARAFLTSFCQTLGEWDLAVTYPEEEQYDYNIVAPPPSRPSRPSLTRSSGQNFAYTGQSFQSIWSSNNAQPISAILPATAAEPAAHSVDQNLTQQTTLSSVAHLEHVPRSVISSASLQNDLILGSCNTRCTVTQDVAVLELLQNKKYRSFISRMRFWKLRARSSLSRLRSVQHEEPNLQAMLADVEQSTATLVAADNVEDCKTHNITDASPKKVGLRKKLSRRINRISQSVRQSSKKSSKGLDWKKEQDIR